MNSIKFQHKYWISLLLIPILRVLSLLPLSVSYRLGSGLGNIFYLLIPKRRNIAKKNLTLCFPHYSSNEIDLITKNTFRNIARVTLTSGINWWSSKKNIQKLIQVENLACFEDAIKSGSNIIFLAPHFVALEIGGIYLSTISPITSMYQRNKNPFINKLTIRGRSRFGAIITERQNSTLTIIRQIRNGHPLYYLPDQDPGIHWHSQKSVFAPFFNQRAATWTTLSRIAKIANAIVLPCKTEILPKGKGFKVSFSAPIKNFPTGDPLEDATIMNQTIESMIEDTPDQYFWVHKRFKTQPMGVGSHYE